jgi:hypothetical protein
MLAFTAADFIGLLALQKRFSAGAAQTVLEQWP